MTISATGATSSTPTAGTTVLSTAEAKYTDNTFLQLLTAQLKNQTPLEPVDNESFMNQMASYQSMSEQRELNTNMLKLLDYQGVLARVQGLGQGSALLNKTVDYADADGRPQSGKVESVYVHESGSVHLRLEGDRDIDMRSVPGISETTAA